MKIIKISMLQEITLSHQQNTVVGGNRHNLPFLGLPLGFESNCGQADAKVKFLARGSRYTFFLTPTEAVLVLRTLQRRTATSAVADTPDRTGTGDAVVVHLQWIGAEPEPRIRGVERQPGKRHYLLGNDPANWCTNVAAYARVEYRDLYPGVDLVYSTNGENLRYDILVAPGTNPEAITLAFEGAERLEIDDKGGLLVHTTAGSIRQPRPGNLLQGLPHTSPSAAGPGRRSRGVRRVRS
jgi:hypothetical protein